MRPGKKAPEYTEIDADVLRQSRKTSNAVWIPGIPNTIYADYCHSESRSESRPGTQTITSAVVAARSETGIPSLAPAIQERVLFLVYRTGKRMCHTESALNSYPFPASSSGNSADQRS